MLPAQHRLRRREEFTATVRGAAGGPRPHRAGTKTLVVHHLHHDTDPVRVGFVVSKAVGNAVRRNKVKRRLRHLMAERISHLPAGSDIVIRALPAAAHADAAQLGEDLDHALRRTLRKIQA